MKDHTNDCAVLRTGKCTCGDGITRQDWYDYFHRFGHVPTRDKLIVWKTVKQQRGQGKAGTSRYIDTEPRKTFLGDTMFEHPRTCGVYKAPEPNWAPYCDCWIREAQHVRTSPVDPPMTDPADVPKEYRPDPASFAKQYASRAPWWVWSLIGFGAGLPLGAWAGWPSW